MAVALAFLSWLPRRSWTVTHGGSGDCIDFVPGLLPDSFALKDRGSFCISGLSEAHGILAQQPSHVDPLDTEETLPPCGFIKISKQPKSNHLLHRSPLLDIHGPSSAFWPVGWPSSVG